MVRVHGKRATNIFRAEILYSMCTSFCRNLVLSSESPHECPMHSKSPLKSPPKSPSKPVSQSPCLFLWLQTSPLGQTPRTLRITHKPVTAPQLSETVPAPALAAPVLCAESRPVARGTAPESQNMLYLDEIRGFSMASHSTSSAMSPSLGWSRSRKLRHSMPAAPSPSSVGPAGFRIAYDSNCPGTRTLHWYNT